MKDKNANLEDFELNKENNCKCEEKCDCDETHNCGCGTECDCGSKCDCDETHDCGCHGKHKENFMHEHKHHKKQDKEMEYLAIAQRLQAEFENYRRHVADQLNRERQEGARSVIEVFLPCLDTFKEAKKSITDEKILEGVNMIENKILETLKQLNVEKIEAIGQVFDPNLHDVIAVLQNENYENDIILEEYQAGYKYNGKVIRYSKVIVNKRGN